MYKLKKVFSNEIGSDEGHVMTLCQILFNGNTLYVISIKAFQIEVDSSKVSN